MMKTSKFLMFRAVLICPVLGAVSVAGIEAAVILVPNNHATIGEAVAAASDGDTIEITNSGIYQERVVIDKRISLIASSGQSPTILSRDLLEEEASLPQGVIVTVPGAAGSQIGSNNGGRINIDGNEFLPVDTTATIIRNIHETGTVTHENLFITGANNINTVAIRPGAGDNVYRNIEIDFFGSGRDAIRFLAEQSILMERVKVRGVTRYGVWINPGPVDLTMRFCDIETNGIVLLVNQGDGHRVNVFGSRLRGTGAGNTGTGLRINPANANVNIDYSVFLTVGPCIIKFPDDAANTTLRIDHSDFVSSGTDAIVIRPNVNAVTDITNSIILAGSPIGSGLVLPAGLALDPDTAEPIQEARSNWTNSYATSEFGNSSSYRGPWEIGENDIVPALDPLYTNISIANMTYAETVLLTASSTGGPIGTNTDFADPTNFPDDIFGTTPPPDGELGDINGDGTINVADVTELANAVASGTADQFGLEIADINNDGAINGLDVQALAALIVNSAP